jgi:uncharacterized protein YjdB
MRNKVAFDLAARIGMPFSPESRFVDVKINDVYQGSYLVSEKTEVKKNRVVLNDPRGILTELDNNYGTAEDHYFYTQTSNTLFTLKDAKSDIPKRLADGTLPPLPADTQAGWDDMQSTLNSLDALLSSSSPDWAQISQLIDVDSFVRYYFVYELTENPEIVASSVYFYKDGPSDKLHAGPVWDFDSSLGNYDKSESLGALTSSDYVKNAKFLRGKGNGWYSDLFRSPDFVQRANQMWQEGIGEAVKQLPTKIDEYAAVVRNSAANNFAVWPILGGPTLLIAGEGKDYAPTYEGEVAYLKNWVTARSDFLESNYGEVPLVRYNSHVADQGWLAKVDNGQISGTAGQSRRLEAFSLAQGTPLASTGMEARSHVQNIGWSGWGGTDLVGSTGQSLRLEAFQLRLTGDLAARYSVSYRAHVQDIGWQPWVADGATAGTTGQGLRIEAIQIRFLKRGPGPIETALTAYSVQVQNIGWMPTVYDGDTAGTTGQSLRVETLKLQATSTTYPGDIQYCGHVQNIGWQACVDSSQAIGTVGQSLRLEAFTVKLTGALAEHYSIRYQAHVQDIGWQPYVADGQVAGTVGQGKRIEAVRIILAPK